MDAGLKDKTQAKTGVSATPDFKKEENKKKILVVEDAESILIAIYDYLSTGFAVSAVSDANSAEDALLEAVQNGNPYDLIVTDVRLPDRSGFDLIRFTRDASPQTRIALITSYEINDFIDYIYEESIDQVMTKHSNMSLHEIYVMAGKLITGDIFGVDKYFKDMRIFYPSEMKNIISLKNRELYSVTIASSEDRVEWINRVSHIMEDYEMPVSVSRLVLDEMITNAVVRAPRYPDGSFKYQTRSPNADTLIPKDFFMLDPEDHVILQFGRYDDWMVISCQDPQGLLTKQEILYRLHRNIALDAKNNLPLGIGDTHGRGIFLMREHLTNLVFNIEHGRKTEVLAFYNTKYDIPYKNISIYEKK